MKKIILFAVLLLITASIVKTTYAQETHAVTSAQLSSYSKGISNPDPRILALENEFIKYESPLFPYAELYIKYADEYGIDWKLLPAISGLESTFGNHLLPDSYNAYGWGGGYIYFKDWEDGIKIISSALKTNYYNKGAVNVYQIGPIYAESPTWAERVNKFMNEIDEEYFKIVSASLDPNL